MVFDLFDTNSIIFFCFSSKYIFSSSLLSVVLRDRNIFGKKTYNRLNVCLLENQTFSANLKNLNNKNHLSFARNHIQMYFISFHYRGEGRKGRILYEIRGQFVSNCFK